MTSIIDESLESCSRRRPPNRPRLATGRPIANRRYSALAIVLLSLVLTVSGNEALFGYPQPQTGKVNAIQPKLVSLGTMKDKSISESSGLAYANVAAYDGAFWTVNDSGHPPIVFLVGDNGKTKSQIKLQNARNIDWEAMCRFEYQGRSHLAIADVGDNSFNRKSYQLVCFPEPEKPKSEVKVEPLVFDFKYEDKSLNCEAVCFEPETQSFWLVEKVYVDAAKADVPGIYTLKLADLKPRTSPDANDEDEENPDGATKELPVARRIAKLPARNITGMSFSPDGTKLVVRTYFTAMLFTKPAGKSWEEVMQDAKPIMLPIPIQSQGEAICFTDDSRSLIVTSEQVRSTIWKIVLNDENAEDGNDESTANQSTPNKPTNDQPDKN